MQSGLDCKIVVDRFSRADTVCVATWNPQYQKLTTSDTTGLIVVWKRHQELWFEDMINNRNKSVVRDMRWNSQGKEICIVYEDGAVIVGGVNGNRLWGKELGFRLHRVAWSPDSRFLLFATEGGAVHFYNNQGTRLGQVGLQAVEDVPGGVEVAGLDWYDGTEGYEDPDAPSLAIAFQNGRVQLMRDYDDMEPVLIDTGMRLRRAKWNPNGTVLALAGSQATTVSSSREVRDVSYLQFYTPRGTHVRTLKVPGGEIRDFTWEGGGLRIAMAVESFIFFANVRPQYRWAAFGDTIVYAFARPDRAEQVIVFWDTKTDFKTFKTVRHLLSIHAAGKHCVIAMRTQDGEELTGGSAAAGHGGASGFGRPSQLRGGVTSALGVGGSATTAAYTLVLFDSIGSPLESKYLHHEPTYVAMTSQHVVAASEDQLYVWQYRTASDRLTTAGAEGNSTAGEAGGDEEDGLQLHRREGRERLFHVDDAMTLDDAAAADPSRASAFSGASGRQAGAAGVGAYHSTVDAICCVVASHECLVVGRESGTVQRYTLPHVVFEARYVLNHRPASIAINCDSTRLSILDMHNILTFFDMSARQTDPSSGAVTEGAYLAGERKDTWAMLWAEDNPHLFASMEKTRLYIFRDGVPEEPVVTSGYPCSFKDLCVRLVLMDDIMNMPEQPECDEMVVDHETRSLRDARSLLDSAGLSSAAQFVEDNPHPRLWLLLVEASLRRLDFATAERAFVQCKDYGGIQWVKRLRLLGDRDKQQAEVAAYFKKFDEAEELYRTMDRTDLAIDLRRRVGDWFRVLELAEENEMEGQDALVAEARNRIGDFYADRQKWRKAVPYYTAARNIEGLAQTFRMLEDYTGLEELVETLPEGSPQLLELGKVLQSAGLSRAAVEALLKGGDVKAAVDACVLLNEWDRAVELAQEYSFPQIEGLLSKYAQHLLDGGKTVAAIELYRKANRASESAKLLAKLAEETLAGKAHPVRAKKLYVLAALEVQRYREQTMDMSAVNASTVTGRGTRTTAAAGTAAAATVAATAATLDTLLQQESQATTMIGGVEKDMRQAARTLDTAWHGAEGVHFWLLAQRQLHAGQVEDAMRSAMRLTLYEDVLDSEDIFALVALTAYYSGFLGVASRAFIRLETLGTQEDATNLWKSGPPQSETGLQQKRDQYRDLAFSIFLRHKPDDPSTRNHNCPNRACRATVKDWQPSCLACGTVFPACTATGRPIRDQSYYRCRTCRHKILRAEMGALACCPLCHAPVSERQEEQRLATKSLRSYGYPGGRAQLPANLSP